MTILNEVVKNGGATVKNNKIMNYKSGYQVAINSQEKQFTTIRKAFNYIKKNGLKNVGIWIDKGICYLDTNTKRINTKKEALQLATENEQLAIWDWKNSKSVYA